MSDDGPIESNDDFIREEEELYKALQRDGHLAIYISMLDRVLEAGRVEEFDMIKERYPTAIEAYENSKRYPRVLTRYMGQFD